jgi:hypothetical protein
MPDELFRRIIVPDYVQMRKVQRQEDGLPLYPGLEFLEAQAAFDRDKQAFKENYIQQERDSKLRLLAEHHGMALTDEKLIIFAETLPGFEFDIGALKGRPNTWNDRAGQRIVNTYCPLNYGVRGS